MANSLGLYFAANWAITFICSGVVPQQPPIILIKFFFKYSSICSPISSGDSSYCPKAFGKPALGWAEIAKSVLLAIASKWGCNKLAPKAQLNPIENKGMCDTEIKKASAVCPDSVLPEA